MDIICTDFVVQTIDTLTFSYVCIGFVVEFVFAFVDDFDYRKEYKKSYRKS